MKCVILRSLRIHASCRKTEMQDLEIDPVDSDLSSILEVYIEGSPDLPPLCDASIHTLIYICRLVIRAIGVSHTACKDEFRRNLRSHSWSVFSFFIIYADTHLSISIRLTLMTAASPASGGRGNRRISNA